MKKFIDESREEILKRSHESQIPAELIFTILEKSPDTFIGGLDRLLKKSVLFSRWILAGSLTATFAVIMSLNELKSIYHFNVLKIFIVCQFLSIFSGSVFLFKNEVKEAISNAFEGKAVQLLDEIKVLLKNSSMIEKYERNSKSAEQIIDDTFKELGKRLWKGRWLYAQISSALIGLIAIGFNAFLIL